MAHHKQKSVYVVMLKSVRVRGMGTLKRGDTAEVNEATADSLLSYEDARVLKGKELAAAKGGTGESNASKS